MCHIRLAEAISEPRLLGFTASSRVKGSPAESLHPVEAAVIVEREREKGEKKGQIILPVQHSPRPFSARPSGVKIAYFTAIRRKIAGSCEGAHAEY